MLVVDTNVLAALVLPTEQTPAAIAVHTLDPQWAAPPLWRSELRSVLAQHVRAGNIDLPAAKETLYLAREIIAHEQDTALGDALELAIDSGCSSYDCEFVVLAQSLEVPLVTLDRALLRRFPDLTVAPSDLKAGS